MRELLLTERQTPREVMVEDVTCSYKAFSSEVEDLKGLVGVSELSVNQILQQVFEEVSLSRTLFTYQFYFFMSESSLEINIYLPL